MMVINNLESVIDVFIINITFPEVFIKINFKCARSYNFSEADGESVSNRVSSIKDWLRKCTTRIGLKVSYYLPLLNVNDAATFSPETLWENLTDLISRSLFIAIRTPPPFLFLLKLIKVTWVRRMTFICSI